MLHNRTVRIHEVSLPIHPGMLVWEGDPPVEIETLKTVAQNGSQVSRFVLGSHTGTHIDAPNHFLEKGSGIDSINLEKLFGPAYVVDLEGIDHPEIIPLDYARVVLGAGSRILFKTGNSKLLHGHTFPSSYTSLSLEAAQDLASRGVVLVGIDFLGIEKRKNPGHPVHVALLEAGIVLVEGLDLSQVSEGEYDIACSPLLVVGADGSPARVVLMEK